MALFIELKTELSRKGWFNSLPRTQDVFDNIENTIRQTMPDDMPRILTRIERSSEIMDVTLHPAAEPCEFKYNNDGTLSCFANTYNVGPGYHVFLAELLRKIGKSHGWKWYAGVTYENAESRMTLEEHGDIHKVRQGMLSWLRNLARQILESEHEHLSVCLPTGYHISGDYFLTSPMGFWTRDQFEPLPQAGDDELAAMGRRFFPWWTPGFDAEFWRNLGMVIVWVELPWHVPEEEDETILYEQTLACLNKARALCNDIELPQTEMAEIETLLAGDDEHTPAPDLMGFKRRNMSRLLTHSWHVTLPGYYYDDTEDDGNTMVYWFGDRVLRGSSQCVVNYGAANTTAAELLEPRPQKHEIEILEQEHLQGWAYIEPTEDNGEKYWRLVGRMATVNNACDITICFDNADDRFWAMETWRSVSHPPVLT